MVLFAKDAKVRSAHTHTTLKISCLLEQQRQQQLTNTNTSAGHFNDHNLLFHRDRAYRILSNFWSIVSNLRTAKLKREHHAQAIRHTHTQTHPFRAPCVATHGWTPYFYRGRSSPLHPRSWVCWNGSFAFVSYSIYSCKPINTELYIIYQAKCCTFPEFLSTPIFANCCVWYRTRP